MDVQGYVEGELDRVGGVGKVVEGAGRTGDTRGGVCGAKIGARGAGLTKDGLGYVGQGQE